MYFHSLILRLSEDDKEYFDKIQIGSKNYSSLFVHNIFLPCGKLEGAWLQLSIRPDAT